MSAVELQIVLVFSSQQMTMMPLSPLVAAIAIILDHQHRENAAAFAASRNTLRTASEIAASANVIYIIITWDIHFCCIDLVY